jgi:hypothetical protein
MAKPKAKKLQADDSTLSGAELDTDAADPIVGTDPVAGTGDAEPDAEPDTEPDTEPGTVTAIEVADPAPVLPLTAALRQEIGIHRRAGDHLRTAPWEALIVRLQEVRNDLPAVIAQTDGDLAARLEALLHLI